MFYFKPANRNARIRNRITQNNQIRTETAGRDAGAINVAVSSAASGATRLFIDLPAGASLRLGGHEARTLYRVLQKHYECTDKSI